MPLQRPMDNADREFFDEHFRAIASRMHEMVIYGNPWRVEYGGCVFKFTVKGYAKRGSERWQQEEEERIQASS